MVVVGNFGIVGLTSYKAVEVDSAPMTDTQSDRCGPALADSFQASGLGKAVPPAKFPDASKGGRRFQRHLVLPSASKAATVLGVSEPRHASKPRTETGTYPFRRSQR